MKSKEIAERATKMLKDKTGEKESGMCWRWARLGTVEALGLPSPGAGMDAKSAALWYQKNGFAIEHDGWKNSVAGDLCFWLHGKHGHVGIRILGNQIAENSSVHSTAGSDARGTRKFNELKAPDIIVRLSS